jgi:hypothetical protein
MIKEFLKYPLGFGVFDLQTFAEGDDGSGGAGGAGRGDNAPKFSGKYAEKIDPVTNQKVWVPIELETFWGHTISKTREAVKKEADDKYKPTLEALEKEAGEGSQAKAELEKLRLEGMSADERAAEVIRKTKLEYETATKLAKDEAQVWKGRFEKTMIANEIMSSFGDSKLCNPGQVAALFELEGQAFIAEILDETGKPSGQFETRVRLVLEDKNGNPEPVEGTPSELFKKWIALDRNAHHLLNSMPSGSGSRGGVNRGGMNTEQFNNLSPTERLKKARQSQ